jgi:hypothetical protein
MSKPAAVERTLRISTEARARRDGDASGRSHCRAYRVAWGLTLAEIRHSVQVAWNVRPTTLPRVRR